MATVKKAAPIGAAFLFLPLLAVCLLGACAGSNKFGGSRQSVLAWSALQGFSETQLVSGDLKLLVLTRNVSANSSTGGTGDLAMVYIEGDGAAWASPYHPPADPTPEAPLALALAAADPGAKVVYLGRPCQYLDAAELSGCPPRFWTSHRFAPEIIAAYQEILDRLRQRYGVEYFTLVGHSGGGVIATLLAHRRADVVKLITVAAPLALSAWTSHHGVSDLTAGLDPAREGVYRRVRQFHFVGTNDRIVPYAVVAPYALQQGVVVRRIEGFDHQCCWSKEWPRLLGEMR